MAGVYVHIPFCARRCIYCGFFSTLRGDEAARYVQALCLELKMRRDYLGGAPVHTLYFGGGTPSRLTPAQIETVVNGIANTLGLEQLQEFTLECNPDDINLEYLTALRRIGVNRISMGVQSFNDGMLRFLARRHNAVQAIQAVDICHKAGIDNVSIDLMYGLPGQTMEMQQSDLDTALGLDVQHISSYCLSFEPGSPLEGMRLKGAVEPLPEDTCASMYSAMCSSMQKSGFEHYEISNFARPGYESRHNSSYWDGTPYLGLGAGAHSFNGKSRMWAPSDLDLYFKAAESKLLEFEHEDLTELDRYNEMVMLGLRTAKGLKLSRLTHAQRSELLSASARFVETGRIVLSNGYMYIPQEYMFVSDGIISELFSE